jgi:UDP-glucose 4-epimerase
MTVLVTGGAGYIGSHMVHALVDEGVRVVVLDNLTTGFDWAVAKGASLVIGDAGDQPRVAALIAEHRVDAVIHFAASIVVPESVRDPLGYYRNNTVNSHALIETAVRGACAISSSLPAPRSMAIPNGCRCAKTTPRYRRHPMGPRS